MGESAQLSLLEVGWWGNEGRPGKRRGPPEEEEARAASCRVRAGPGPVLGHGHRVSCLRAGEAGAEPGEDPLTCPLTPPRPPLQDPGQPLPGGASKIVFASLFAFV